VQEITSVLEPKGSSAKQKYSQTLDPILNQPSLHSRTHFNITTPCLYLFRVDMMILLPLQTT